MVAHSLKMSIRLLRKEIRFLPLRLGIYTGFGVSFLSATMRRLTPSISFDYGFKRIRGIISIGGFMSYSQNNPSSDISI